MDIADPQIAPNKCTWKLDSERNRRTQWPEWGWGGVKFTGGKCYEGIRFNAISGTKGWVCDKFPGKKRYVGLTQRGAVSPVVGRTLYTPAARDRLPG